MAHTWSVYDFDVGAEHIMHAHNYIFSRKRVLGLQQVVLLCNEVLQLLQAQLLPLFVVIQERTLWFVAVSVISHLQPDRPPRFGASTNVVELEAHQTLYQGCTTRQHLSNSLIMIQTLAIYVW